MKAGKWITSFTCSMFTPHPSPSQIKDEMSQSMHRIALQLSSGDQKGALKTYSEVATSSSLDEVIMNGGVNELFLIDASEISVL